MIKKSMVKALKLNWFTGLSQFHYYWLVCCTSFQIYWDFCILLNFVLLQHLQFLTILWIIWVESVFKILLGTISLLVVNYYCQGKWDQAGTWIALVFGIPRNWRPISRAFNPRPMHVRYETLFHTLKNMLVGYHMKEGYVICLHVSRRDRGVAKYRYYALHSNTL